MPEKPRVLVLGGMTSCAQGVVNYLMRPPREGICSYLRVADKYLVQPPTTYVGGRAQTTFKQPNVEYMQANFVHPDRIDAVFQPPEGHPPFDFVLDCTGEVRVNRNDDVYFETLADMVKNIGLAAVRHNVKAYVRMTHSFYEMPEEEGHCSESDPIEPYDTRGYWWHEACRVLAAIPELPLVIVRVGATYGPQQLWGAVNSRILVGRVYQYTGQEMKYMWAPGIRYNTVHSEDVGRAMYHCALWMRDVGQEAALNQAGEVLRHFPYDDPYTENVVERLIPGCADKNFVAPLFNLVDDGDTTYESTGQAIADAFGLRFSFVTMEETIATLAPETLIQSVHEINEDHRMQWEELIETSNPPVLNTQISPFVDLHKFECHPIALTNHKIKRILGYKFKHPRFTKEEVLDIVRAYREDGDWPN